MDVLTLTGVQLRDSRRFSMTEIAQALKLVNDWEYRVKEGEIDDLRNVYAAEEFEDGAGI